LKFLQQQASIALIRLRVINVPQKASFTSAIGVRTSRQALIVEIISADGIIGYGECSCRPDPYYSHEFVDGAVMVLKDFIVPQLRPNSTYEHLLQVNSKIRGWHFAKAAIEFAFNDNIRRRTGRGLIEVFNLPSVKQVPVGISLGIFSKVKDLLTKTNEVINEGYRRIKFKISPSYNHPDILNAISSIDFDNISLDANGSFGQQDFDLLSAFAGMGYIIEQPFPPGHQYLEQAYAAGQYAPIKICLDEEIESLGILKSYQGSFDEVNIKPGRVGGLLQTLQMITYSKEKEIDAWIGGMFETGIGRAQNLQIASLLTAAKAHDQSPSDRYFQRDVLKKPIRMKHGFIDEKEFNLVEVDLDALNDMTISLDEIAL
jgi:O-succinylbenzoate synthase